MKQIIKGKLYNTSTAQFIAEAHKNYPNGWSETLYRTKKGAWFLLRDAEFLITLIPYTPDEALAWLEVRAGVDVALEHFGSQVVEA